MSSYDPKEFKKALNVVRYAYNRQNALDEEHLIEEEGNRRIKFPLCFLKEEKVEKMEMILAFSRRMLSIPLGKDVDETKATIAYAWLDYLHLVDDYSSVHIEKEIIFSPDELNGSLVMLKQSFGGRKGYLEKEYSASYYLYLKKDVQLKARTLDNGNDFTDISEKKCFLEELSIKEIMVGSRFFGFNSKRCLAQHITAAVTSIQQEAAIYIVAYRDRFYRDSERESVESSYIGLQRELEFRNELGERNLIGIRDPYGNTQDVMRRIWKR
ncbi:MAG: hypothetical protein Q7S74_00730 [Nanoarchaeota archaeon]|nr:hypothetical protein [Nanoarchaeota archaeon]